MKTDDAAQEGADHRTQPAVDQPAAAASPCGPCGQRQGSHCVAPGGWGPETEATRTIVKLRRPPRRFSFWLGVILMALSFGIYPSYPVVPFLPISVWRKGGLVVGLSAVSWGMFFVGSVLVGKKGVAYLKRRFFERREHQRGRDRT